MAVEGQGQQSNQGGLRSTVGTGFVFLEGWLIFLTAYFFICFIQFLQRVQQFLWGENVRGSWGAEKTVSLLAPVPTAFPFLLFSSQLCIRPPAPTLVWA